MPNPKNFTEKLDIKLIRLVKDNPVLYDCSYAKYMDFNAREVAWQKIGDELRRPAADCKMRWVNIRDVSRRIVRKSLINPNQRSRPYKYCNELQFMRAFYREVSLPSNEYDSDGDQTNDMDNDNDAPGFNAKMINDTDIAEDYLEAPADSDSEVEKPVKKERKRGRSKKSKNFEETKLETSYSEAAPIELEPSDPVDAFLLSIGATLKTFSPYHLNLAKSKIFAVVQEHDLQQIVQKQRHEAQGNDVKISTTDPMFLQ